MPNSQQDGETGAPNEADPNAWTDADANNEGEATEQGSREDAPEGFESEVEAYRRLLAQRRAAEQQEEEDE